MKTLCAAAAVLVLVGCGRTVGPPPPLPVEQIPTEIKKVFGKAKPEVNDLITTINSTLQAKDYAAAYQAVQILCNLPDETKDQRLLAARAMLTVSGLLEAAQAQGDQKAAAILNYQKKNR